MIHLGARAFEDIGGEVVQTTSFIMKYDASDKEINEEFTHSNYSANIDRKLQNVKANISYYLKEIIENSGHIKSEENTKEKHNLDAHNGFEKYTARFIVMDNQYNITKEHSCVIVVRCPNYKERYIYDIVDIKKVGPPQR